MIDFHCHILPGLDDGPADISESIEMAVMLASSGFSKIYCTPHRIKGTYDAGSSTVRMAVIELQSRLDKDGIGITLHPGREYYADEFFPTIFDDPLTLGGAGVLLFEVSSQASWEVIKNAVYQVVRRKLVPLLAHPERYPALHLSRGKWFSIGRRDTSLAKAKTLIDMGCHFQGNIGSFTGSYGKEAMQTATMYLEMGMYSCLGTDSHSIRHLDWVLSKGLRRVAEIIGRDEVEKMFMESWH